jgi:spore germination protein YaaH
MRTYWLGGALAASVMPLWITACGPAPAPQPKTHTNSSKSPAKPKPAAKAGPSASRLKVIAFYDQSMGTVAPDPFALIEAHPSLVTYLSPFWYEVSATGSLIAKPEGNAATLAARDHLPLMPLINNAGGTDAFLHSATTRLAAVHHIVTLLKTHPYVGVNIDFQGLKAADSTDLTAFMKALHQAMPAKDVLSMSVVPLNSGSGESSAYNLAQLNPLVNSMVLMAYDFHGDGTPPGPVSPYDWVKAGIAATLKAGVQPSKLYLGIANYGYLWTNGSTKATTIPLKVMHQHKYGVYHWSPTYKEAYDTYTMNGTRHVIWFVNDRAAVDRIRLAERDHRAGVAFWRVGYEDATWWDAVAKALTTPATTAGTTSAARRPATPRHLKKALNAPAHRAGNTLQKSASKTRRTLKGPTKKTLIAPAHKAKTMVKKASHTRP